MGELAEPTSRVPRATSPLSLVERDRDAAESGKKNERGIEGKREREKRPERAERAEKPEGERERRRDRLSPDVHRTLFFILHYPCSAPLRSIMPAPRINDESRRFRATLMSIRRLPSRNTDKHRFLWPVCARHAAKTRSRRCLRWMKGMHQGWILRLERELWMREISGCGC